MKVYAITKRAVRRWILRTLQPCRQMVPLMSQSMDRRLGLIEYLKLRLHRLVCAWCDRYFKQLRLLRRSIQLRMAIATEDTQSVGTLTTDARQRISESLVPSANNNCSDRV